MMPNSSTLKWACLLNVLCAMCETLDRELNIRKVLATGILIYPKNKVLRLIWSPSSQYYLYRSWGLALWQVNQAVPIDFVAYCTFFLLSRAGTPGQRSWYLLSFMSVIPFDHGNIHDRLIKYCVSL